MRALSQVDKQGLCASINEGLAPRRGVQRRQERVDTGPHLLSQSVCEQLVGPGTISITQMGADGGSYGGIGSS